MDTPLAASVVSAGLILLALLAVPVPLLPPHALAEAVQSLLGVNWKTAYLVAALGLQSVFYGSLGLVAALSLPRAPGAHGRLLQSALLPCAVVGIALLIRSAKAGHLPIWTNAIVPIVACVVGVWLGLGLFHRSWVVALGGAVVIGAALWAWLAGPPSALRRSTEARLRRIVAAHPSLPEGDARLGQLLQAAFETPPDEPPVSAIEHNRAAILALGIAVGDRRVARLVGLERDSLLVRQAVSAGEGATLRGRVDWSKHYTVSAALAVLEHPLVSDAAGLMKEQLDALAKGTGFSFADMAADRAGVRFAMAATHSDGAAHALQGRLRGGFAVADFFPAVADLPENLTVEQFRQDYGRVGSPRYREFITAIEARLDSCPGLSPP